VYTYICVCVCVCVYIYIYQGQAVPLQTWTVPEGFRRMRLPDVKTNGTWWR